MKLTRLLRNDILLSARLGGLYVWMLSSAGEHRPYKAGVVGSKPTVSTTSKRVSSLWVNSEVAKRG